MVQAADGSQQRVGQRLLLPGSQPSGNPPPQDPALDAHVGRGMGELALQSGPRLGDSPIVDRQPVTRPQGETQQVQPPRLVHRAAAAARLDFHERLPQPPAKRRGPLVAAAADGRRKTFDQSLGLVAAGGTERALDQRSTTAPDRFVDDPFAFGLRLVGGDVGLRGRTHVELEPPTPPATDLTAPQIERADFRQPGVQVDRDGKRGPVQFAGTALRVLRTNWTCPLFPRAEHGPHRWQRGHLRAVDGHQLARLVRQSRAGDEQRKLGRLGDQEVETPLGKRDVLPRLNSRRQ